MRLRTLRFSGIGPFAGRETIDFTRFEDSGLFLLEGPTGAGKSTVIDAIVFALYGDVARQKDSSKDRLRSAYAGSRDPSSVELDFEVPTGTYRVTRTPSFQREGRRTPVNTTIHLERLAEGTDGDLVPVEGLSRSIGEADAEITHLIGLTKDQFLQTVVLPQGKFSRFLTSSSEERQGILRDIFDAAVFQRVQDRLRERARGAGAATDAAEQALREAAASFTPPDEGAPTVGTGAGAEGGSGTGGGTSPVDLPTSTTSPGPLHLRDLVRGDCSELLPAADALVAQAQERSRAASQRADATATEAARAAAALTAVMELDALVVERTGLEARLAHLLSEEPEVDGQRERLDAANRAALVASALEGARRSATALGTAGQELDDALARVEEAGVLPEDTDPDDTDHLTAHLRRQREDLTARRGALVDLLAVEAGIPERQEALDAEHTRLTASEASLAASREEAEGLPRRIAAERATAEEARHRAELLPALEERARSLAARLTAAAEAERLVTEVGEAAAAERAAGDGAHEAANRAAVAHTRWLHGTSGALAAGLSEGEPCPVCGSPEHPHPAPPPEGGAVTLEEVERLSGLQRTADRELATAREHHLRLEAALGTQRALADGGLSAIQAEVDTNAAAIRAAQADGRRAEESTKRVEELSSRHQELTRETGERGTQLATARADVAARRRELDADRARCTERAGAEGSLGALDERLSAAIHAAQQALDALASLASAACTHSEALSRRDHDLVEAGFPTGTEGAELARAALLGAAATAQLRESVTTHEQQLASTREALAQPRLEAVAGEERPDPAPARSTSEAAARAHDEALRRAGHCDSRLEHLHGTRRRLARLLGELTRVRSAQEPVRRLAALATASTPENLSQTPLGSWVLMSRFDDVLAAANPRLLAISEGRYELRRTLNDDTRARKSGLGLEVLDHDTDEARAPRTLSGGETFFTSLALALGLADVVTAEAGGIELRTMFIDEGFGSLDSEKLDIVMSQLSALRDSGRTIGVISHVDEMARRIPDQVNVRWNARSGSTLSIRA